jgi:hypothetical protein
MAPLLAATMNPTLTRQTLPRLDQIGSSQGCDIWHNAVPHPGPGRPVSVRAPYRYSGGTLNLDRYLRLRKCSSDGRPCVHLSLLLVLAPAYALYESYVRPRCPSR